MATQLITQTGIVLKAKGALIQNQAGKAGIRQEMSPSGQSKQSGFRSKRYSEHVCVLGPQQARRPDLPPLKDLAASLSKRK